MPNGLLPPEVRASLERFLGNLERYDEFAPGLGEHDSLPEVLLDAICRDAEKLEEWYWQPGTTGERIELLREMVRAGLDLIARACDPDVPNPTAFPPMIFRRPPAGFSTQGRKLLADVLAQDLEPQATRPPMNHPPTPPKADEKGADATRPTPPPAAPPGEEAAAPPVRSQYTLGWLIQWLDGSDRNREIRLVNHQEQYRRSPGSAMMNRAYEAALSWRPEELNIPGIRRIEVLCDLEDGEAGITAAKVRRLRARICRQQHWQPQHANELTLDEAADILEGVQRVTLDDQQRLSQDTFHHGLATIDTITVGAGEVVQVTGLSCKVIAGTTPTPCPNANPPLPPSLIPVAEQAIRRLNRLPAGTTIHWVGHDTGYRSRCRCHPDAPFAAPFDQARWTGVVRPEPPAPAGPAEGSNPQASEPVNDTTASGDTGPTPCLDAGELAVLTVLRDAHPKLLLNVDIVAAVELSKQTVDNAVKELLGKKLIHRPKGKRKGTTVTAEGIALVDRIRKSSVDHP
jgi:hypothetical protein